MANIPVIAEINTLLDANDLTIAKAALGVLGAATTGNASIVAADIAAGAVTVDKIGALAVTDAKLAANAVIEAKIATGAVTAGKLATSAVDLTTSTVTGTLQVNKGGTGAATLAANNVLLGNGTTALQVVAPSTAGNVLTSNGTTWTSSPVSSDTTPALYEDFSRYPDNTVLTLSPASLPDIGNKWQWSRNNANTTAPLITGGALRGDLVGGTSVFYFGNDVGETIRSISFELEFVSGGSGVGNIGTTYAFHSVPVLNDTGTGIPGLNTPNMLHFEVNQKGLAKMGFNQGTGANFEIMQPMGITQLGDGSTPYSTNVAGGDILGNGKHIITFSFKGNDCVVTALGSSWLFRHPPAKNGLSFSAIPANGNTFTVGGVTYTWKTVLAAAYDVKIGASILISSQNAASALNAGAGAGSAYGTGTLINPLVRGSFAFDTFLGFEARRAGPAGNSISCSVNTTPATLLTAGGYLTGGERTPISAAGNIRYWWYETDYAPSTQVGHALLYRIWANAPESYNNIRSESIVAKLMTSGQLTLSQNLTFTSPFTCGSTADFNGDLRRTPYSIGTNVGAKQVVANLETKTSADLLSAVGSVYTTGNLLVMAGRQPALGAVNVYELSGFFANTVDDRRIALNELYSGNIFDSGVLAGATVANKMWTMRVTMQRTGTNYKRYITEFTVSGAATVIQTYLLTSTTSPADINFRTTSVALGDVQIYTYFSTTFMI